MSIGSISSSSLHGLRPLQGGAQPHQPAGAEPAKDPKRAQAAACPSCQGNGCPSCSPEAAENGTRKARDLGARAAVQGPTGEPRLSEEEQREVEEMKARDREVRAHEAAHQAAAGNLARGGASFTYQTGPDGARYAVGGEVSIDTSEVAGDPAATLAKAQRIRQAALAPAEPSGQDRSVAQAAAAMASKARAEMAQQAADEVQTEADAPIQAGPLLPELYA